MNSKNKSFYNNKAISKQKDWGKVSSAECGNEIRKAVLDFEKNLIEDQSTIENNELR